MRRPIGVAKRSQKTRETSYEARVPVRSVKVERLTFEERKAKDAERRLDAQRALLEHQLAQEAFHKNRERLRAERLAREAKK